MMPAISSFCTFSLSGGPRISSFSLSFRLSPTRNLEYNLKNFDFEDVLFSRTKAALAYSLQSKYDLANKYFGKSDCSLRDSSGESLNAEDFSAVDEESIDIDSPVPSELSRSILLSASAALQLAQCSTTRKNHFALW